MSFKKQNFLVPSVVLVGSLFFSAPAFSQTTSTSTSTGAGAVTGMVSSLSGVADNAYPIAVGVTGFAVAALLIKRVLYA